MYCITSENILNKKETVYLAWQNPAWDESGYFWTSKETFEKCLCNNTKEHPFLFRNKTEAITHLKSIDIPQKCRVIKWIA